MNKIKMHYDFFVSDAGELFEASLGEIQWFEMCFNYVVSIK